MPKAIVQDASPQGPSLGAELRGFAQALVKWQRVHGRHDLPWQESLQPYPVWLSEVMLQQTQVSTVKAYFAKFMTRFPRLEDLAQASQEEVMSLWSGLGYYSRGRHLHACAKTVVERFGGQFPREVKDLVQLPGIGPSTAAAIASICFAKREAIMDGNVARVLTRYLGFEGDLSMSVHQRHLKTLAQQLLPAHGKDMPTYTQGIMDLGATVCMPKRAHCDRCPVKDHCVARAKNKVLDLPLKSKKIKRKHQSIYWLLAMNDAGEVLGAPRSLGGIWAGMHAFPEFQSEEALVQSLPQGAKPRALEVLRHELTHLSLSIHAFELDLTSIESVNTKGKAKGKVRAKNSTQVEKNTKTAQSANPRSVSPMARTFPMQTSAKSFEGFQWMSREQWLQVGRPKPVTELLAHWDGVE